MIPMEQKIEGQLELGIDLKGSKGIIYADKVVYSGNSINFIKSEAQILSLSLNKPYKTIYEALKSLGIKADGY